MGLDIRVISVVLVVFIFLLGGSLTAFLLVSLNKEENESDENPNEDLGLDLNEEEQTEMDRICSRYKELLDSENSDDLMALLVNEINDEYSLIENAELSEDEYTVSIKWKSGTRILLMGDDGMVPDEEPTRGSIQNYPDGLEDVNISYLSVGSKAPCPLEGNIPANKKALIINAASLSNPYWSRYSEQHIKEAVSNTGMDEGGIKEKKRINKTDGGFTPDDLLDYHGYGLVFYIGHGGYLKGAGPGRHYIQCSNVIKYKPIVGEKRHKDYKQWVRDEYLVGGFYLDPKTGNLTKEIYMDTDLIGMYGSADPGTIMFILSCNSWRVADDFRSAGFGSYLGWDEKAHFNEAAEIFKTVTEHMSKEDQTRSDKNSLEDLPEDSITDSSGAVLRVSTNGFGSYFPFWGNLTFDPSAIHPGTTRFEVEIPSSDGDITYEMEKGRTYDLGMLVPKDRYATIRTYDDLGSIIETGVAELDLECGHKDLKITSWEPFAIVIDAEPDKVAANGIDTSTVKATVRIWKSTDILVPTGDPIPCKNVTFHSSLGSFIGTETLRTDENGEAIIELSSEEAGTANLKAFIEKDGMESTGIYSVKFGESGGISLDAGKVLLDYSPERISPDSSVITATVTDGSGNPMTETDVYFTSNFGRIVGQNPARTDGSGEARIKIEVDPYSFSPNPTNMRFAYTGTVSVSFDGEIEEDSIEFTIDAKQWVNVVFSGSETSREMRDPNATFQAEGINIQMALDNSSDWRTIWRSSGSVSHSPGNFYPFEMKTIKRTSVMYLFFEYTAMSSISTTYIHMFNSWVEYVQEVPSFSGTSGDPKGDFNFTIP
jgi:hypothetical protein